MGELFPCPSGAGADQGGGGRAIFALTPAFFVVAWIYSMAGFGGGSSYIALLVLWGWDLKTLPLVALACNLIVVGQGSWLLARGGRLPWRAAWPFLAASVPAAFLGGAWRLPSQILPYLLGGTLLLAGAAMLAPARRREGDDLGLCSPRRIWCSGAPAGAGLGLLAGLSGIGGGIFLSPLLHLIGLGTPRQIAALASLFILANSASGLAGQLTKAPPAAFLEALPLMLAVLAGGQLGARLAAKRLSQRMLVRWTAILVLAAGIRLLWP